MVKDDADGLISLHSKLLYTVSGLGVRLMTVAASGVNM